MKKKTITPEEIKVPEGKLMTRKQAIKKSGYMALSAVTMMMLLHDSANGQTSSGGPDHSAPANPNGVSPNHNGIWND